MVKRINIVGSGVVGLSAALAIKQKFADAIKLVVISDRDFEKTCSYGPAGIFRVDSLDTKEWARTSFYNFASIYKQFSPLDTGVQLISGYMQTDNYEHFKNQENCMRDIVYNFREVDDDEKNAIFSRTFKYCFNYTAYSSEGQRYVPWLRKQLEAFDGVEFVRKELTSIDDLINSSEYNPDIVINCAGLNGGKLAGDDSSVYPSRGVALQVRAPFQKHFNYKDTTTFAIPTIDSLRIGTLRQANRFDTEVTEVDKQEIWNNYLALDPNFKGEIIGTWCGLRPCRPKVRLEYFDVKKNNGEQCRLIHNYGHGSNGFVLGWGCAQELIKWIL